MPQKQPGTSANAIANAITVRMTFWRTGNRQNRLSRPDTQSMRLRFIFSWMTLILQQHENSTLACKQKQSCNDRT